MSVGKRADAQQQPLRGERSCSRAFKVVEVSSGTVLAEAAIDMRATIEVLSRIDSIFDVSLAVWHREAAAWRALTPGEQRALWDVRER